MEDLMAEYIGAIDQGTTSTRFIIFNKTGTILGVSKKEHDQICLQPGWVEHDPVQIWENTCTVIQEALEKAGIQGKDLVSIGITNQRETVVAWDKTTGKPFYNAIVWQCARTESICKKLIEEAGQNRFQTKTGLPVATYFSGTKIKWILENVSGMKNAVEKNRVLFGTMDTWLIWNLTGGPRGGKHVTDVSNASRTMLMNLETLQWDAEILDILGIPLQVLPQIVPSSDDSAFGRTLAGGPFRSAVPICGVLGDQQAALFGQTCFAAGEAKNTYGTGCFLLFNTGTTPVFSNHGLLTTLGFQIAGQRPVYALEGSIAYAGALVQWIRDNIGLVGSAGEIETLARTVEDNGDVYCVPAFSGLFAPYWRSDARGVIAGLTQFVTRGHLARAVLEASAFQTKDIMEAIIKDLEALNIAHSGLNSLRVDGGMVENQLLMQFQADILGVEVIRPQVMETTALGAAYAAGLASGVWADLQELQKNWSVFATWFPVMDENRREKLYAGWKKAVERTLGWN